jgi:hypothetical protein
LLRKSNASNFDPKAAIFLGDVAHCETSLQTLNAVSGDQLYRYYRFLCDGTSTSKELSGQFYRRKFYS